MAGNLIKMCSLHGWIWIARTEDMVGMGTASEGGNYYDTTDYLT